MNKILAIILFFCIGNSYGQNSVSLRGDQAQDESIITFYFIEGVKSYVSGDLKNAAEVFDYIGKITDQTHAPSLFYRSRIDYHTNKLDQAEEYIVKALELDSLNTDYLQLYARLEVDRNNLDKAYATYLKLNALDTTKQEYKVFLPILTYLKGDIQRAVALINSFEKQYGYDDRLYAIKREYLISNELYDSLADYTERVLALDPNNVDKLIHSAQVSASYGNDSAALIYYKRAIVAAQGGVAPYVAFADFFKVRRDYQGYAKALEEVYKSDVVVAQFKIESFLSLIQMAPQEQVKNKVLDKVARILVDHEMSHTEIVKIYIEYLIYRGGMDDGIAFCDSLYTSGNFNKDLGEIYVHTLYQNKQIDRARDISFALALKNPKDLEIVGLASHLQSLKGDNKKALLLLNSAIKAIEDDSIKSVAYGFRGDFYYERKQSSKYYADYRKSLELNPDNAIVLNNLAYFMAIDGKDLNQALLYVKRANELSQQNPIYLDTQAWVNFLMGRYDEAKRLMQLVFALDRNPSHVMLLHYGDILYALGDDFMARDYWNRALKSGADEKEVSIRVSKPKAVK